MNELSEAFTIIRHYTPAHVEELVNVLERRLILAETLVRLHEQHNRLLASGDAFADEVSPPNPEKADRTATCAEANNIVPIDPHKDRYSWKVEGAAS